MKVIAIHQVDYLDPKTNKVKIGHPGSTIDLPKDTALALLVGSNPAVRRLSEAEQALDRARAEAMSRTQVETEGGDVAAVDGATEVEGEDVAAADGAADVVEPETKTTRKRGARSAGDY